MVYDSKTAFFEDVPQLSFENELIINLIGMFLLPSLIVYWILGAIVTYFDYTKQPQMWVENKVQSLESNEVKREDIMKVSKYVLMNQLCIGMPSTIAFHYLMMWRGYDRRLPSFTQFCSQNIAFFIIDEINVYYFHRFVLHHQKLYKYVHKLHHQYTSPFGLAAFYLHPLEYFWFAQLTLFSGPFIFGSHLIVTSFRITLFTIFQIFGHSSIQFSFFPPFLTPEAHDIHHSNFNQMYGVIGILDALHGTDKAYKESELYKNRYFWKMNPFKCVSGKEKNQ